MQKEGESDLVLEGIHREDTIDLDLLKIMGEVIKNGWDLKIQKIQKIDK